MDKKTKSKKKEVKPHLEVNVKRVPCIVEFKIGRNVFTLSESDAEVILSKLKEGLGKDSYWED